MTRKPKASAVVLTRAQWTMIADGLYVLASKNGGHPYGNEAQAIRGIIGISGEIAAANGVAPAKVRRK